MASMVACSSSAEAARRGSAHRLPVPWERSTTPLSWGRRGGLATTSTPSPVSQSSRSVGRSPLDLQGVPLSTRIRCGSPRRAKQRRSVAWVSRAGTVFQGPRGENDGLQDRPAALVDDPEPAGLGGAGQLHLVGGVDLPGLVRPLGPAVGPAATPAGGRGIQPGLGEGPEDGPLAGQGRVGTGASQVGCSRLIAITAPIRSVSARRA